jgi:hypothetical protein
MKRTTLLWITALAALTLGSTAWAGGSHRYSGPYSDGYRANNHSYNYRHDGRRHNRHYGYNGYSRHDKRHYGCNHGKHYRNHRRGHGQHYGGHRYGHGNRHQSYVYNSHHHRHGVVVKIGYGYRNNYQWCDDHSGYYRNGDIYYGGY